MMRSILALVVVLISLLSGCTGYAGLINYPFDPGGKSLNSPTSDLTPQIAGRYVAFASDRSGRQNIYLFDTIAQKLIDLPLLNQLDTIAAHPDVSSDGRYIVFSSSRQGRTGIFIYDRELRQSRNLTANLQSQVQNPTISADGNTIAFESSRGTQFSP